jgi:hypothetical protein
MQASITYDEIIIYKSLLSIQFNGLYAIILNSIIIPLGEYVLNFQCGHVVLRPPSKTINRI